MVKLWLFVIFSSSVGMVAFASIYTAHSGMNAAPSLFSNMTEEQLKERAENCSREKQAALRINDVKSYVELVSNMDCARAELVVYGS